MDSGGGVTGLTLYGKQKKSTTDPIPLPASRQGDIFQFGLTDGRFLSY